MNLLTSEPGTSCHNNKYVIRQEWQSGYQIWMETVLSSKCEAKAVAMYKHFIKRWPDEHFELIHIEHKETCIQAHNTDDEY